MSVVCCQSRVLCDGLITRPQESYRLWRVVVCDLETSKIRRLKPATGLWKIQPNGCNAKKTIKNMKYVDRCDPHTVCNFYYSGLEIEELGGGNDR